jgi:hypothetical protein
MCVRRSTVTVCVDAIVPSTEMPAAPLLSAAAAANTADRPHRPELLDQDLLRLRRWPNLTRLPADVDVGLLARICALLGRKPTVGFLVARMLDMPHLRVAPLLARLHAAGCIESVRSVAPTASEPPPASAPAASTLPDRRFVALLWRLLTR